MNLIMKCLICCIVLAGLTGNCGEPCGSTTKSTSVYKRFATNSTPSVGYATWYSRASCQREGTGGKQILMANGKPLNDNALTCAIWGIKFGTKIKVKNISNGLEAIVTVTDRGPGRKSRSRGTIIDLTPTAMRELAGEQGIKQGKIKVELEVI